MSLTAKGLAHFLSLVFVAILDAVFFFPFGLFPDWLFLLNRKAMDLYEFIFTLPAK